MSCMRWRILFITGLICLAAVLALVGTPVGAQGEPAGVTVTPSAEAIVVAPPLLAPSPAVANDTVTLQALAAAEEQLAASVAAAVLEFATDSASIDVASDPTAAPRAELRMQSFALEGNRFVVNLVGPADALNVVSWGEIAHEIDMAVTETAAAAGIGWPSVVEYQIRLNGLPPASPVDPAPTAEVDTAAPAVADSIVGKKIVLSPGHGRYEASGWPFQRSEYYGAIEDLVNLDMISALNQALSSTGAERRPTRQLDKNAGNHSASGRSWWEMGAREYLRSQGLPDHIWNQSGQIPFWQDLMARPNYANYIGADVMVSLHNNGGGGTGTETWYDISNGYSTESLRLANLVHNKVIERIRRDWNANWTDRHVKGSENYGENRWYNGPAILIEVGFMDNPADIAAIRDTRFQAIVAGAIRDALIEFYGGNSDTCGDNRFKVEYFRGREPGVGSPVHTACVDAPLDNNWGDGGPGNGVPNDEFSARWTGRFNFSGGNTRFVIVGDDGVRLWVDGAGVLTNGWKLQAPTEYKPEVNLSAGMHDVKFEFFEAGGGATARLRWEAAGTDYTPPAGYTFCAWEDQRCNFTDRTDVAYGANGRFHYRSGLTGGIDCNNTAFGDPISGVFKACFKRSSGNSGNLALNRSATATSQESSSYSPSKGNDGNGGTRWSSAISPTLGTQFWRVDLGSQQSFNRVRVNWETAYAAQYRVLWSDDGENWYCFCDTVLTPNGAGWMTYTFSTRLRRYVGIQMLARAPQMNNYSFWEMEVYYDSSRVDDSAIPEQLGFTEK